MTEILNSQEIIEKLHNIFFAKNGYKAVDLKRTRKDGKKLFDYQRIREPLQEQHYSNHYRTEHGLVPSPIVDEDQCCFGAIDVDTYDMDRETKLTIIDKCRQYKLHPCYSESRGLHIYAFIGENSYVSCNTMRNFLRKICKYLGLSPKTEIFPKQDRVEGDEIGNGIKIPYRAWNLHSAKGQTGIGIVVNPHKKTEIFELDVEQFIRNVENNLLTKEELNEYDYEDVKEDPTKPLGHTPEFDEGSMNDPEIQDMTYTAILKKIRDEKMSLDDDSYYDDLVTLSVGKMVVGKLDNDVILEKIREYLGEAYEDDYFLKKVQRARSKFDIEEPRYARKKIVENLVYIKDVDKFYDIEKGKEYSKEAINYENAIHFNQRVACTNWLKTIPNRKIVETWVCKPTEYNPGDPIFYRGNLKYLNSWKPNNIEATKGDTSLLHKLLDHIFNKQKEYIDHFLDYWAYMVQHPGIKIRYGLILVTPHYQVGKGSIFRAMKLTIGKNNTREIDINQAVDRSKTFLIDSQLCLIDETQSKGNFDEKKKLLNDLKRIITEDVINVRELYKEYREVETCTNYIIFSNNKDALSLPANDVRYWVYISERPRMEQSFYDEYHQWLDNQGANEILYELENREISESFNPKGIAPKTPFIQSMSEAGEHPLTAQIRTLYEECEFPFTEDRIVIGSRELHEWLEKNKPKTPGRLNEVKDALISIGGRGLGQVKIHVSNNKEQQLIRPTLYLIRKQEQYHNRSAQDLANEFYVPLYPDQK